MTEDFRKATIRTAVLLLATIGYLAVMGLGAYVTAQWVEVHPVISMAVLGSYLVGSVLATLVYAALFRGVMR